jgi:pyruvyl transferase EpsO
VSAGARGPSLGDGTADPVAREVNPDASLIRGWSDEIDRTLAALVPRGQRVALVNFPNHRNAGDPALWLGALAALARIGARVVYRASWAAYDETALRRALGSGTVLIQGGGNFGDLYPARQQATRERILVELADLRTVQLPQSIHFEDPANRERVRRACEDHGDLTLLVRDRASLEWAQDLVDVPSRLCPDLSMALGPLPRPRPPSVDVVWLRRRDPEARQDGSAAPPTGMSVRVTDWLAELADEPRPGRADQLAGWVNGRMLQWHQRGSRLSRRAWRVDAATYERLARLWVARGLHLLADGRVVVTDRLHGHLLALLMGIPNVVLDNRIGKVGAYLDTWSSAASLTHPAGDRTEALALARDLLAPR